MDELKLKLSTKLMRGLVAKLISMTIKSKFGCKVNIQLDELSVSVINGETEISTSIKAKMDSEEFTKIISNINLED